jgi:hypothetical protein
MREDRAISDAIGFILVFAIIISTVAVVYIGGFDSIDNARQYERMNNAERAFEVFADNVEDVTHRGSPSRATEIKLSSASLQEAPRRSVEVNVTRNGDPSTFAAHNVSYWPLVYESRTDESNKLYYALGGTFRASSGGTTMSTEPAWVLNESRVIIPIIQTDHVGDGGVTGDVTVLIRTVHTDRELLVDNATHSSDVTVDMNTPAADAWRSYLEEEGMSCPAAANTDDRVFCERTDVETVYVTRIVIHYEFE